MKIKDLGCPEVLSPEGGWDRPTNFAECGRHLAASWKESGSRASAIKEPEVAVGTCEMATAMED